MSLSVETFVDVALCVCVRACVCVCVVCVREGSQPVIDAHSSPLVELCVCVRACACVGAARQMVELFIVVLKKRCQLLENALLSCSLQQ